jgi:hypothetical protein
MISELDAIVSSLGTVALLHAGIAVKAVNVERASKDDELARSERTKDMAVPFLVEWRRRFFGYELQRR